MSLVNKSALLKGAAAALAFTFLGVSAANAVDPGYRLLDANNTIVVDTTKGRIVFEMYPQLAPNHVAQILTLTRQHFYDNVIFHRVIEDFMDQAGDPKGTGLGGSSLPDIKAEFTARHDASFPMVVTARPTGSLVGFLGAMPVESQVNELMAISKDNKVQAWGLYCQGVVGMARDNDPDSANSQFFFMRASNPALEKRYTAFGEVVSGLDVVKKIKIGEPAVNPDKMLKVQVMADMPVADQPKIEIMDTQSAQFQTLVDEVRKIKGADFSDCDITMPTWDMTKPMPAPVAPPTTGKKK